MKIGDKMNVESKADKIKEWGVLPNATILRRLRNQGMTYKEIADLYGTTESGVWRAFDRAGLINQRPTYRDIVPWAVDRKFARTQIMQHLRTLAKMQAELEVSPKDVESAKNWIADMESEGVILAYHPEAPANVASSKGGFYYVKREPGDEGWFRE